MVKLGFLGLLVESWAGSGKICMLLSRWHEEKPSHIGLDIRAGKCR